MDSDIELAEQLVAEGRKFDPKNFCYPPESHDRSFGGPDTEGWFTWTRRTSNFIGRKFADDSAIVGLARSALLIHTNGYPLANFVRKQAALLMALNTAIEAIKADSFGELRQPIARNSDPAKSNKVFVVHGHDQLLKTEVEAFLRSVGLEPVVLHRQADKGRTLIEKFEEHSDVGYVFVLLTPDEIAYTVDQELIADNSRRKEYRARPNVIFEFGYFVGRLGRDRVCCIFRPSVSMPSDLAGLVYKELAGTLDALAYPIMRELKAAGYKVEI